MAAKKENVSSDGNKIVNTAEEGCYHSDNGHDETENNITERKCMFLMMECTDST
jgi:hypothetical protein